MLMSETIEKSKCCSTECDGHANVETLRLFFEKKTNNNNNNNNKKHKR
jgi:hypothetical protein